MSEAVAVEAAIDPPGDGSRVARQRKANSIYSEANFISCDDSFKKEIREFQNGGLGKKNKRPVQNSAHSTDQNSDEPKLKIGKRQKVSEAQCADLSGSSVPHKVAKNKSSALILSRVDDSHDLGSKNGKKKSAASVPTSSSSAARNQLPPLPNAPLIKAQQMTPKERERERERVELEENLIARTELCRMKRRRKPPPLPVGPSDPIEHLNLAIKKGVKECTTLLMDWSKPGAKLVGSLCKVYWDGENQWYYARILNYDSYHNKHYVYYMEDSTAEWLSIGDEFVFVAEALVMANYSGRWPAIRFWASPKAKEISKTLAGYHKNCEYIEYFNDVEMPLKEYAFISAASLSPISEESMPKKSTKKIESAMEAARREKIQMDAVIDAVLSAVRSGAFSALNGSEWVGTRVRANTHRLLLPGETKEVLHVIEASIGYRQLYAFCNDPLQCVIIMSNRL
jgi:hypothetical protein